MTFEDIADYIVKTVEEGIKLDRELFLDQFDEIEKKIERLIEVCHAQKTSNLELKNKLKSVEEELQGKIEAEKSYAEEKALIRSKIDNLLAKLEDITEA